MAFFGIDQSYSGFGLTRLNNDGKTYESTLGKFDLARYKGDPVARLRDIETWLTEQLSMWNLTSVCIEGYANGAKFGREMAGELGWAVKRTVDHLGGRAISVPPTSVKKFATGSGTAKKNEMLLSVYKRWGVEFKDDNLADSFVLAKIAEAIHSNRSDLPKFQLDVLAKLS